MKRQQQGITSIPSTSGRDLNEILTEPKVNSALSWAFIPPELLDSIMGFLDKKDVTWFKNMRLVNLHWNSAANSMMERCRHRVLRTFKPFHGGFWYMDQIYNGRYRQLFIPTVKMSPYNQNSDAVKEIERAINKKLQIGGAENEIESRTGYPKSLYLCPEVEGVNWSRIVELEEMSEPLLYVPDVPLVSIDTQSEIEFPVTWTFEKHLTSLILHGIQYSPEQLQKILKNASQLQVLEIFKTIVVTKNNEDFEEKWPLPTISSLTTLLVKKNCGGVGVIVNSYPNRL